MPKPATPREAWLESEVRRLRLALDTVTRLVYGKLVLAEVDMSDIERPVVAIIVAPDTTDEQAAAALVPHMRFLLAQLGIKVGDHAVGGPAPSPEP